MTQNDNQQWQAELQQRLSEIVANKFNALAGEIERLQSVFREASETVERITAQSGAQISAADLETVTTQIHQVVSETARQSAAQVESETQTRLENVRTETESRVREELEAKINELQAQLESSQQANLAPQPLVTETGPVSSGLNAEILKAAINDIDAQRQQADILATLVRYATSFAPRLVFFVIKGGNAIGWKASGFSNGLNDETVRSLSFPATSSPLLAQALGNQSTALLPAEARESNAPLLGQFGPLGEQAAAIPLVIRGKAAAVLYVDTDAQTQSNVSTEVLESLMRVTAMAIELLPVRRSVEQQQAPRPAAAPEPEAPAPPQSVEAPAEVQVAASMPQAFHHAVGEEAAVTVAPLPSAPQAFVQPIQPEPAPVIMPLPTIPTIVEPEPETVSAQPVSEPPPPPPVTTPVTPVNTTDASTEERAHMDARRFARLLVSEIKLYNESKVAEGRRSQDLYERLKEDIDRSRQMYEKRVSPAVAAKFDYFYDELVHTLGEGDAAKLGSGCPGPTVPIS